MKFKIGDVVMLKSGGPPMTVTIEMRESSRPACYCSWFDAVGKVNEKEFPMDALQLVPDKTQ